MQPFSLLGVRIDQLDRAQLREHLKKVLHGTECCHLATVNPEFLVEASHNEKFRHILQHTDLNICDGIGITLVAKLLYGQKVQRITGVEIAETICELAAELDKSVFFLGGFGVAETAAQTMQERFPGLQVAGTLDGDETTRDEVKQAQPDIILVAFGAPKQEYWLAAKATQIPSLRLGVGVGGTFDFWAEKVPRAPQWMRRLGLEWLYRLLREPLKRSRRITNAVIVFPVLALRERLRAKS